MFFFSIIIPIYNEKENVIGLVEEIIQILKKKYNYEILIVNDGSEDLEKYFFQFLQDKYNFLKIINHKKNMGQSKAIQTGILNAMNETIITIDGDGQNNPKDILNLVNLYFKNDYRLIGGLRINRKDNIVKKISSKIANNIRQCILNDECLDTGCSLKIFSKKVYLEFPYFSGNHRFLPALFKGYGYSTKFIPVDHRKRIKGISKYGTLDRAFKGLKDLVYVRSLIKQFRND